MTQKELVRTRRDEQQKPVALFQLPEGTSVSVTVNQSQTQDVVVEANSDIMRNVTPTKDKGEHTA